MTTPDAPATALTRAAGDVRGALRSLRGVGTVGDVVSASGLPRDKVESELKGLLEELEGQVDVSDTGEIVYRFDPGLVRRGREPLRVRLRRRVGTLLKGGFKAWIVVMLTGYFAVFVALAVAAVVAMASRGGGGRGGGRGGGWGGVGRGRGGLDPLLWYWIWSPRWRIGRPYYGQRWERTLPKRDVVPFYKKVFAFVFGPDRPEPTPEQIDRSTIRLIRANDGVLTEAELIGHAGLTAPEAGPEMGRLVGAYGGEPLVSAKGELVYAFPELLVSAHGRVRETAPRPTWQRLEVGVPVTGNGRSTNTLIGGMNGFNLLAAATAPWFIFPQLGIGGPAALVGLVVIPVLFSLLFFAVPALRVAMVRRENGRRHRRNLRRVVLGHVYRHALTSTGPIGVSEVVRGIGPAIGGQVVQPVEVEAALHGIAAEFDADVTARADGSLGFAFPAIRAQFAAGEALRHRLRLGDRELGEIVYSSGDTAAEAAARDLAAFDRALESGAIELAGNLPPAESVDFEEDFEIVAADLPARGRAR